MWRTRDGYTVRMPLFRVRRLQRRLKTRGRDHLAGRAATRLAGTLIGRATRTSKRPTEFPVFLTRLGLSRVLIYTRRLAPRRVELLYMRRS